MATLTTNGKDTLDKEIFIDLVKDAGGWSDFLYGIYQKLLRVAQDHLKLKEQVHQLESTMEATVDDWVTDALKNTPKDDEEEESAPRYFKNRKGALVPEYQGEQMLGDRSPYGWHLLHPDCKSWDTVNWLRDRITDACKAQGIFNTADPTLLQNSVESAVHRNAQFKAYRDWVWQQTGEPQAKPAIMGLDPWSYMDGLKDLAGPADDPAYRCYFIEIHMRSR